MQLKTKRNMEYIDNRALKLIIRVGCIQPELKLIYSQVSKYKYNVVGVAKDNLKMLSLKVNSSTILNLHPLLSPTQRVLEALDHTNIVP